VKTLEAKSIDIVLRAESISKTHDRAADVFKESLVEANAVPDREVADPKLEIDCLPDTVLGRRLGLQIVEKVVAKRDREAIDEFQTQRRAYRHILLATDVVIEARPYPDARCHAIEKLVLQTQRRPLRGILVGR